MEPVGNESVSRPRELQGSELYEVRAVMLGLALLASCDWRITTGGARIASYLTSGTPVPVAQIAGAMLDDLAYRGGDVDQWLRETDDPDEIASPVERVAQLFAADAPPLFVWRGHADIGGAA